MLPDTLSEQFVLYLDVLDGGSFSAAARKHPLTPSAVARRMDALERAVGSTLLVRTTHTVRAGRRRMAPGRDPHRPRLVAPGLFAKRLVRRGAAWRKDLMKTSFLLALLLSCWSQVQAADDDGKELPPIERYDYGMPLDIERVLSVTPVPATCGVVPLVMLYRDSAGRLHRLQYRGLGAGCSRH